VKFGRSTAHSCWRNKRCRGPIDLTGTVAGRLVLVDSIGESFVPILRIAEYLASFSTADMMLGEQSAWFASSVVTQPLRTRGLRLITSRPKRSWRQLCATDDLGTAKGPVVASPTRVTLAVQLSASVESKDRSRGVERGGLQLKEYVVVASCANALCRFHT
jgi:hypothetical protein